MRFMTAISFRPDDQAKIAPLLAQEQAHTRELMGRGVVEAIYIGGDSAHPTVWLVLHASSEDDVEPVLRTFPLFPYMQFEVTPLT